MVIEDAIWLNVLDEKRFKVKMTLQTKRTDPKRFLPCSFLKFETDSKLPKEPTLSSHLAKMT